eukprot:TRINITY_DN52474_c0_g1_i1.p1 TRINITY_DN52474_c0_g1~~TRINITY_DN52474_c0_g1_i1.p1  ORF type:complete len:239 (-),score=42.28 TRINITY_DN52474_c0_g1_i1:76-792(-)
MAMLPLLCSVLLMECLRFTWAISATPALQRQLQVEPPPSQGSPGISQLALGNPMQASVLGLLRLAAALIALGYVSYLVLQTVQRRNKDVGLVTAAQTEIDKEFEEYVTKNPKYCHDREGFTLWKEHRQRKAEFQEKQARKEAAVAAAHGLKAQKKAEQEERFEKEMCEWRGPGGVKDNEVRVITVPKPKVRPGAYAKHMAEYHARIRAEGGATPEADEPMQIKVGERPLTSIPEDPSN